MSTLPYSVSRLKVALQLVSGVSPIDGDKMPMIIYACENLVQPSENCGQCKWFTSYKPHLHCKWNGTHCSDRGITNDTTECGYPEINMVPVVTSIEPAFGPMSGGTSVSVNGRHLNIGRKATVRIGPKECVLTTRNLRQITCKTKDMFLNEPTPLEVVVEIDGARVLGNMSLKYNYSEDPFIKKIHPLTSFASGGRTLIVEGTNLHVVGKPKIYAVFDVDPWRYRYFEIKSEMETCTMVGQPGSTTLNCTFPIYSYKNKTKEEDGAPARLGFEMDDVLSVTAYNLPSNIAAVQYFSDPVLTNFTEDLVYNGGRIAIKGKLNRHMLAESDYVKVYIGCELCNEITLSTKAIGCEPPVNKPVCWENGTQPLPIDVEIGYFRQRVGFLVYKEDTTTQSMKTDAEITTVVFTTSDDPNNMITAVIVLTVLVVAAVIAIGIISLISYRKNRNRRGGELNTPVVYRRNETAESNVNRNTSAVLHISRRATTVIYDDIADGDIVNEYLELSGEDPTYTEADVYIDPYHKTDFTIDQAAIINDTPLSDDPENMHLQPLEKSSRSGVPGIQENVDELQNDTNDGKVNPAESQEGFKDATEESKSTEKDDWQIDDCTPNVDGGYIHPVWSQELRESKCENMLETPRSSYVGKSMETSDEVLASGQGHTVDNDDGFINASGGQEKDLELAKHGETSESADIMYKEKEEETTLE
ncbi:uncharacterized protein LOC123527872 isoform X2 [Mercenaria mercenaria]|uniref:uncharacterized protein LOC123527872 isoform X2 n=1 Tax=Mercenaria mercenaria TaxID=6596 RepID=UPI00234FA857|nr:uncharacterized protein LOC123527872 isoform X2 [Mercenaria mercenaria]